MICVSFVYATTNNQTVRRVQVPRDTNLSQALKFCEKKIQRPDMNLRDCTFAVWGETVQPNYRLKNGDRVEICRPLSADPKNLRKKRASRKKTSSIVRNQRRSF